MERVAVSGRVVVVSLLTVTFAVAAPAAAQRVRGTARDSVTGQPVSGVVAWVSDSAGKFLARSIGDDSGTFAVMRLAGSARLRIMRIGYRPREIALHEGAGDTTVDVPLAALTPLLETVEATSRRVCPGEKGTGRALELWEQARTALLASVVAREASAPTVRLLSFTRTLEPLKLHVLRQQLTRREVVVDKSYVAARPAWQFAADGYMQEHRGGDRTFYAPDDEVLLDPSFAEVHCLRVVAGTAEHAGEAGISFEPVRTGGRDTLVDVAGVLWMGGSPPQLRSLEFHYTDLEPAAKGSGGELIFRVMPNGAPMIERWHIRSALLRAEENLHPSRVYHRPPDRPDRRDVTLTGYSEVGGAIASATWPDGRKWAAPLPRISGRVALADGSAAGAARVWLEDTSDSTTTAADGSFSFPPVMPGRYFVLAADTTLAKIGLTRGWGGTVVGPGDSASVDVYYFGMSELIKGQCKDQSIPAGTGVMFGRLKDLGGSPLSEGRVAATWSDDGSGNGRSKPDRVENADEEGRFAICGAPLDRPVRLRAQRDDVQADADVKMKGDVTALVLVLRPQSAHGGLPRR
jgi:hypothetical protein